MIALASPALRHGACLLVAFALAASAHPGEPSNPRAPRTPDEPVFLEGDAEAAFAAEIERSMSSLRVVVARFRQEQTFSFFDETVVTEGVLVYERPGRLRYELTAPHRSLLVVDEDDIGRFVHDGEAWERRDLDRRADVLLAMMGRVRSMFDGRFTADDPFYVARLAAEPEPLVRFDPRDAELARSLPVLELLLADDLATVHTVRQLHANGDHAETRYTAVARDVELPQGLFRTGKLPAAVDLEALARAEAERVAREAEGEADDAAADEPADPDRGGGSHDEADDAEPRDAPR